MKNNYIGILFFSSFFIIGLYPLQSGGSIRAWSIILSLVFLLIIIIKPNLFIFLNILYLKFGILFKKIISSIIIFILFYFIITPIGIVVRILKKDVMNLKKKKYSYWIIRKNKLQSMKKQF